LFVAEDPIGIGGGLNGYAYAGGNPVSYVDPLGLYSWDEFVDDAANGSAGFGDSLSFALTKVVRDRWNIGSVNTCGSAYVFGENAELAFEVFGMGLSAGLKALARRVDREAVREAAEAYLRNVPRKGGQLHHANPLFGHPGGSGTIFPTGGLPTAVHSGLWNIQWVGSWAEHLSVHRYLQRLEAYASIAVNPGTTAIRAARNYASGCECR
jgi:uncharacterized protein RhaS with RHS repeats